VNVNFGIIITYEKYFIVSIHVAIMRNDYTLSKYGSQISWSMLTVFLPNP